MCDQIVFHIRISHFFFKQEIIQVANSGKLVHIQTIVNHIIVDDIQNDSAIDVAEVTITSDHNANHKTHQIINKIDFSIDNLWDCSSCSSSRFLIIQYV